MRAPMEGAPQSELPPLFDVSITEYLPLAQNARQYLSHGRAYSTESARLIVSDRENEGSELLEGGTMGFVAHSAQAYDWEQPRPLIFGWNGGPVSPASTGIDIQLLGPKIIRHKPGAHLDEALEIEENASTPLKWADVVSVDPVGSGIGGSLPWHRPERYFDVQRDIDVATAFIEWYMELRKYNESETPLILAGASYAAFRITGVALALQERGIAVDGLAFFSGHYDYSLQEYDPAGDPKPYALRLPAMALAAQAHGRLEGEIAYRPYDRLYEEVNEFARGRYMEVVSHLGHVALWQRQEVVEQLAAYTGLSEDFIDAADLRVHHDAFRQELLREEGLVLSALDGRLAFENLETAIDPAVDRWEAGYLEAMKKYPDIFPYATQHYQGVIKASAKWKFGGLWEKRRVHEAMERLLSLQPDIQVLHAAGAYDFINPPACAEDFWQELSKKTDIPVTSQMAARTTGVYRRDAGVDIPVFPAGHAIGSDPAARSMLGTALRAFVQVIRKRKN